jgi:hypothetical protein
MSLLRVQDILDATGAVLVRGDLRRSVCGVSTDTRTIGARALFVALSGENFDGNRFAVQAAQKGAGMVLLRGVPGDPLPDLPGDVVIALHAEPRRALGDLAAWHRSRLDAFVIGVTGSCGKTTTKNILGQLLESRCAPSRRPRRSTTTSACRTRCCSPTRTPTRSSSRWARRPGEIAQLARIVRPFGGIVTNIGQAHLEGLGSIEGVAREKSDLFAALPRDGFAVLNLDSRCADLLRSSTSARVLTISVDGDGELNATRPHFESGYTTFRLNGREVSSPLLGLHNISNLLAALAACTGMGSRSRKCCPPCKVSRAAASAWSATRSATCWCSTTATTPTPTARRRRCASCAGCTASSGACSCSATCSSWARARPSCTTRSARRSPSRASTCSSPSASSRARLRAAPWSAASPGTCRALRRGRGSRGEPRRAAARRRGRGDQGQPAHGARAPDPAPAGLSTGRGRPDDVPVLLDKFLGLNLFGYITFRVAMAG